MSAAWRRLPILARAVIVGALVTVAGTLPWSLLAEANRRLAPAVPWSVAVMALYLWLYWSVLDGRTWPGSTSAARRERLRARPLSRRVWRAALLAGALGWGGLVALRVAFDAVLALPRGPVLDTSTLPAATVAAHVLMLALVAGVAEEAGFRGYMQGPIEQRHGLLVALLVASCVFWLAHAPHYAGNPRVFLLHGWFYLGASSLLGLLAYWTSSILPCVVLHAAGDVVGIVLLAWLASPDGHGGRALAPSAGAMAVVLLTGAIWAGHRLANLARG